MGGLDVDGSSVSCSRHVGRLEVNVFVLSVG